MLTKKICILGLGYIGLPTAAMFATNGHQIIGVDINEEVVHELNEARILIKEPYLDKLVEAAVISGKLKASMQPEKADVFIIAVPTPIKPDKTADMRYVIEATKTIVPYLQEENIVILESTSPIGTVRDIMAPILAESGLVIGEQLLLAHSPERVLPGRILIELVENNRIIGGINYKSAVAVRDLYKSFVKGRIFLTDATTAEMCKLMENTYRDVNIALANELASICEEIGINAWEVIQLCNKHPRVNILNPGPGVGGHCIAVDPWFIVEKYPKEAKMIALARQINDAKPNYVAQKVDKILAPIKGKKKICILGAAYKANIDDVRESPIIELIKLLKTRNYDLSIVDPYIDKSSYETEDILSAAKQSDLILLGVNHEEFSKIEFKQVSKIMRHRIILDTRGFFDAEKMAELGFKYYLLGNGIYREA
ncbi:nucleotide sugar dehydrogenase [Dehalobacter sp. TBBPA1]|uniref:nucleotide sugar dehydrogenase n=1 Tax=Dehalobacter sp. TBBPA1 TaxID=3235037 RepID=UPI0034A18F6E